MEMVNQISKLTMKIAVHAACDIFQKKNAVYDDRRERIDLSCPMLATYSINYHGLSDLFFKLTMAGCLYFYFDLFMLNYMEQNLLCTFY
jgi:hypothetical protein